MRRRDLIKDASGATALEFGLISPVLILLIVGAIQFAWTLHCAATVRWALETNARNLMMQPTETADTLKAAMLNSLSGKATASDLTVTIASDTSGPNTMLVATSTYRTTLAVPFVSSTPLVFTSVTKVPSL